MDENEVIAASFNRRFVTLFGVFLLVAALIWPVIQPAEHRRSGVAVPRR